MGQMNRREFSQAVVGIGGAAWLSQPAAVIDGQTGRAVAPHGSITDVQGIRVGHFNAVGTPRKKPP